MSSALNPFAQHQEVAKKIFADRLEALHEHLLVVSIPATLLCASAVFFALYHLGSQRLLLGWYLSILAVSAFRAGLLKWYEQDRSRLALHLKLFTLGTALSGVIWGLAGCLLTPLHQLLPQVFIIIIIAGLNAGGCQTLKASRTANCLFMATSILPLVAWTLMQKQELYTYLSIAIFGYLLFMLSLANKNYLQFIASLRLQYENELLLKQLKEMNSELHAEIQEHENAKNKLRYLATRDFLTGLDNRYSFDIAFEKTLLAAGSMKSEFCVLYADLDYFKRINDNYGHDQGDCILFEVAKRLRKQLREQDSIARMGGDEFIILIVDQEAEKAARHFVREVQKDFTVPFMLENQALLLSISFGSSLFPRDGRDKKSLLKKADIALYQAKLAGRNGYEVYQEAEKALE